MNILVTGGAGYIGSHTVIELLKQGHSVVIVDNLVNSSREAVHRVEEITNQTIPFYELDLRDKTGLERIFSEHSFDAIIHFAGLKAVGESVQKPLEYYDNNLGSTLVLLEVAKANSVKKVLFSSSATVYGSSDALPFTEETPVGEGITNPYGQTKYMIEQILQDLAIADNTFEITILRYFNPVGAHESGRIGEDPNGIPNNLLPFVAQVAVGKLEKVRVFGGDYDTPDGTGLRDYIHVVDLAKGHAAALEHMQPGAHVYNLGTGTGTSVLEIITAFGHAANMNIPYEIVARRDGDVAASYASPDKAARELNWQAEKTIQDAVADSWRWQSQNPNGYN